MTEFEVRLNNRLNYYSDIMRSAWNANPIITFSEEWVVNIHCRGSKKWWSKRIFCSTANFNYPAKMAYKVLENKQKAPKNIGNYPSASDWLAEFNKLCQPIPSRPLKVSSNRVLNFHIDLGLGWNKHFRIFITDKNKDSPHRKPEAIAKMVASHILFHYNCNMRRGFFHFNNTRLPDEVEFAIYPRIARAKYERINKNLSCV